MKKFCLVVALMILVSAFPIMTTAYAATYQTLELDDTCSIEIPSSASYWKTSNGLKYYKSGSFVIQIDVLSSKLSLSSELSSYKSLGLVADYDSSKTSVKCVYGLDMDSKGNVYSLIGFNSKQHGIRIGVLFDIDSDTQTNYFLHIIDSIKVYDKKEEETTDKNGWVQEGGGWRYYENNTACKGWKQINGKWYYFDASGVMKTGWYTDNGNWYYFASSGEMATGWIQSGNDWYLMNANGVMQTDWVNSNGKWYYFSPSGVMASGWLKIGENWYCFANSGEMVTGWIQSGNTWYYLKESGAMAAKEWIQDTDGSWYWMDENGIMVTGWKEIDGQWELFADSGIWMYTWDGQ